MKIFTIGVSQKSAAEFFTLLRQAGVEKIIDIRRLNTSQLLGFAKGRDLEYFCEKCHAIQYQHIPEWAPPEALLKKYRQDKDWTWFRHEYQCTLESRPTLEEFKKIIQQTQSICLLCSEPTPEKCHRRLLTGYLTERIEDLEVIHL